MFGAGVIVLKLNHLTRYDLNPMPSVFFAQQIRLYWLLLFIGTVLHGDDSWKVYDDSEIAVIQITLDPEDLQWMYENVQSDSLHPAAIHFQNTQIDEIVDSVGFRLRGNTSRVSAKKSFKIDFNHFFPGRDFFGLEKLNLNGEHNDPSIVRSKICWDLFQDIGMTASRAAHAEVYINDEYYGLYISVEHIDDSFLSRNYENDNGNLWKCLWPADLSYRGENPENYHPYYDDKRPYELKTNKDEYDFSKLARLIRIIHFSPDSLELVLNIKETIQYFAMNILTGSWDDYRFLKNNYYLYHNPSDDLIHWIPYDYDNTFSIDWFDIDWSAIDPYEYAVIDNDGRPLTDYMFDQTRYQNLLTHFIEFYSAMVFSPDSLELMLDILQQSLIPSAEDDLYRTYDYGFDMNDFIDSYGDTYENQHVKQGIMEFINTRLSALGSQLSYGGTEPIIYDAIVTPGPVLTTEMIALNTAVFGPGGVDDVIYHYKKDDQTDWLTTALNPAPDTMSRRVEDHDRWQAGTQITEPGLYQWYLTAIYDGEVDRYPVYGYRRIQVAEPWGGTEVQINELLAKNVLTNADESGEYDDWLELSSTAAGTIDLSGHYLTDKTDNLTKWQFPDSGMTLNPGEHLLVWCDEDQEQGELHTNFKLSSGGEFLAIVAPDAHTIIDSLTFPAQSDDVSYGRIGSVPDTWAYMEPTPGSANQALEIDPSPVVSGKFHLQKVFPNPFNPRLHINIRVAEPERLITVSLVSLLGQTVAVKHYESLPMGTSKLTVVPEKPAMSSGVYFLVVTDGDAVKKRKVLYLK